MAEDYQTLSDIKEVKLNILNSLFIGNAKEVNNQVEAKEFIKNIKAKYPDASHSASGFIVAGQEGFDDDREPSGSAGIPILNTIKKNNLNNLVVVVTRYFGGKKLGIRGLINAYGEAGERVIRTGKIITRSSGFLITIETNYSGADTISKKNFLPEHKIIKVDYKDLVQVELFVKNSCLDDFEVKIKSLEYRIIGKKKYIL